MNRKKNIRSFLSLMLTVALIAAMALVFASCDESGQESPPQAEQPRTNDGAVQTVGQGSVSFEFSVCFADGSSRSYVVKTDKSTVGEALVETGLITGYDGPYGLTVETVCGEFHDFNKDSMYWGFFINGEYAMTGVDSTPIVENEKYELKATRA